MLRKTLRTLYSKFCKQKQYPLLGKQQSQYNNKQYLIFPTKFPIFPYNTYFTQINKYFYEYLKKQNISRVVAASLRTGVSKQALYPQSYESLIKTFKLKQSSSSKTSKTSVQQNKLKDKSGLIFDQPVTANKQHPIYFIDSLKKLNPIASLCKIQFNQNEQQAQNDKCYFAYLRSQTRYQITTQISQENTEPIMYLSGKEIRCQNLSKVTADITTLWATYHNNFTISKFHPPNSISHINKQLQVFSGFLCTSQLATSAQIYQLFKTTNSSQRIHLLTKYYNLYLSQLQTQQKQMKFQIPKIDKEQKKYYYKKILSNLQNIISLKSDVKYVNQMKQKLSTGRYPTHIVKLLTAKLDNILTLDANNPQTNKKKHMINLIMDYPFGIRAKQTYDFQNAKKILDEDHYGMKKVKQRILQLIAVSKLRGSFKSKGILLHGPPGVGKTSIVKSIAKCLNRSYGRICVGGEHDPNLLRGHRKTYVGAYPGKIFDTINKSKIQNPIILIDELDKISSSSRGNLQDAILYILDQIQNHKFKDQFLDIQIDLSQVLFICTANQIHSIFPPLLDRLELIEVCGYTTEEKKQIFYRHVIKNSMTEAGLPPALQHQINFTNQALHLLIQGYCKQAGIRNLTRKTNTIFQKMAYKYVKNQQFDKQLTPTTLKQYLGGPQYKQVRLFEKIPPLGVMTGLAWNASGGTIMYIQASAINQNSNPNTPINSISSNNLPTSGQLIVTGNLHDVMKQSCQLAFTYAKFITATLFNNYFLQLNDIHLNFPQIQIGKDGPSAGIAITCTFISLALKKSPIKQIAMTGQINLSGHVSAIGGIKQKIMGAKRQGITHLIFPLQNQKDVSQIDKQLKQSINFYFVDHFYQVMEHVFGIKAKQISQSATATASA